MDTKATSKLVRELYRAYESGDPSVLKATLADDFTFTSPYDDHIDRSAYFARCWPNHERIKAMHIEKLVVEGGDVFVIYTCEPRTGARFRNVEYLVFDGDKLKRVEVYFGDPPFGIAKEAYPSFLSAAQEAWKATQGAEPSGGGESIRGSKGSPT
jgi:ketosteroid isomerase-like protein